MLNPGQPFGNRSGPFGLSRWFGGDLEVVFVLLDFLRGVDICLQLGQPVGLEPVLLVRESRVSCGLEFGAGRWVRPISGECRT